MKYVQLSIFTAILILFSACRKSNYELNPEQILLDSGNGIGNTILKKGHNYIIDGLVFVNDGQTLMIEPGVVVRAKTGQGTSASALIVARGGKIIANGTAEDPIIFTVEGDDLNGSIPLKNKGLWGGIILLGNAPINSQAQEASIEGILETESRGLFGGNIANDNSGVLKYVSIRHGGTNIGQENEINGLTLGGVGSETIIDHIEVLSNLDDGIEIFGGCVNLKNIVVAFCGDDAIDCDMGYSGKIQFILAIQDYGTCDKILEADELGVSFPPYLSPIISNGTFVGRGESISTKLISYDGTGGASVYNSAFINQHDGIFLFNSSESSSSFGRFKSKQFEIKNNAFFNVAQNNDTLVFRTFGNPTDQNDSEFLRQYFSQNLNTFTNLEFSIDENQFNPIPQNPFNTAITLADPWFDQVAYLGAFGDENWALGWTAISQYGFLK